MILTGYDNNRTIPRDLDILGEAWYMDQYNISYPTLSPTLAPTVPSPTAEPTSMYCYSYENYTQIYENVPRFRERRAGQGYLESASEAFIAEGDGTTYSECVDGRTADELAYYYDFTHDPDADTLTLDMIFCCGDGKVFDTNSVGIPDTFASNGNGDAFLGDDAEDTEEADAIQMKEILVFGISGLILLCCCIIGMLVCYKKCYLDKRYKTKELEAQVDKQVNNNGNNENDVNMPPPATNIVVQPSFDTYDEGTQSGNYSREPSSVEPGHVIR